MTNKEVYQALCAKNPAAIPVFFQSWWLDAVCKDEWDAVISRKGEQVSGCWPYRINKRIGISFLRNPKLTPYTGPLVLFPQDMKESNCDSYEYEVTEELLKSLPEADVWGLSLLPGFRQAGVFKRFSLNIGVQQTFLLNVQKEDTDLFQQMKESIRRNIRAAEKEIIIASEPEAIHELFEFQKQTLSEKSVGQAYTEDEMKRLLEACLAHASGEILTARQDGIIQAVIWNVWDASTSYYFMGAKNSKAENYRAMSALLWHCIKKAKARGNKNFDFEGSMDEGVERFFRGFGGRRELYLVLRRDDHLLWKIIRGLGIR